MMKVAGRKGSNDAVKQLLGDDVLVVSGRQWQINKHITVNYWTVNYPEQSLPNQFGKIVCPSADGSDIHTQLMYLQHHFTELTSAVVLSVSFDNAFIDQWSASTLLAEKAFKDNHSGLQIPLCSQTKANIASFLSMGDAAPDFGNSLMQLEMVISMLRRAAAHINAMADKYAVPACSFLANNAERDKVLQAREILEEEFEQTITIKDLSRRVAINECYLKKGFKAMFHKTIHEFQQDLRIHKAKRLLQTEGYTVSEVAITLGYSSISHFSTAFKKATNMKPCELLR